MSGRAYAIVRWLRNLIALRLDWRLVALAAGIAAFAALAFSTRAFNDGDTYWHVATGERMLDLGQVLHADPFSHTMKGARWRTHEWGSEILMALAYRAAGWTGVVLLYCASGFVAAALMTRYLARWLPTWAVILALGLVYGCLSTSILYRPHLLTLSVVIAWVSGLALAADAKRTAPWALLPLMTLWANMHGGYILGLALIAPLGLEAALGAPRAELRRTLRSWVAFGLAAIAAALITPHGLDGLTFPLKVMTMANLQSITEWRPINIVRRWPVELTVGLVVLATWLRGVRVPATRALVLLGLIHMTITHVRHQVMLGVVGAILAAGPIGRTLTRPSEVKAPRLLLTLAAALAAAGVVGLSGYKLSHPVVRRDGTVTPAAALAHVPQAVRKLPVLNHYDYGGFLIFHGVPTFVDGRADMFGDEFLTRYFAAVNGNAGQLDWALDRYHVAWTLLSPRSKSVELLDKKAGWRRLYADKRAVVHVREDVMPVQGRVTSTPSSTTR